MSSKNLTGQCQCGYVKYHVTGIPVTMFACHCKECQRQSSSAFGLALWVRSYKLKLIEGSIKTWVRTTPSDIEMACDFCPRCGSRLFHRLMSQTEIISIKPGTLDNADAYKPVGHIWMSRAHEWLKIGDNCLTYDTNPDTFDEMIEAWARLEQ